MKRRFFGAVLCLSALPWGCAPTAPEVGSSDKGELSFQDSPVQKELDTVAVLTPLEEETHELWSALVLELKDEFNIVTIPVGRGTATDDIARELNRSHPDCVVVIDNRTLSLYRDLQTRLPNHHFPPAVVVMTSFLDRAMGSLRSATGIAYEVPAVSSIMAFREVSARPIQTVGIVHRKTFAQEVKAQARLLEVEKVELIAVEINNEPTAQEVEDSLDLLVVKKKVDALWVLNDNRLLTPEMLGASWLPVLRFRPTPVIVGVSALVHPEVHFGTLAVYPQHTQLGVQAANLIFDLADNEWELETQGEVELPLAVVTVVDVKQVKDFFALRTAGLTNVDKAVK